jgi:RecA/RadA recombinase
MKIHKMTKIDVSKIIKDMQALYQKDKKVQTLICTGDTVKQDYTKEDGIQLPPAHPLKQLTGLNIIPFNKIVQIAGKADSGKSTMAGEIMSAAQKQGIQVILLDSEAKFDAQRFKTHFGGDPSTVLMVKTNETRKGGELVRRYVSAIKDQDDGAKILFVWDSVGGSQGRAHAEMELDSEKHAAPGADAKDNGAVVKMLVGLMNKYPDSISVYLANQTYAKIGFMAHGDAIAGGTKIEYHSSLIVTLRRVKVLTKQVKGVMTKTGIITRAIVTKNHLSQNATSVHQLDFVVTADGSSLSDQEIREEEDDE